MKHPTFFLKKTKKVKRKKKKLPSLSKLMDEADRVFSIHIRKSYADAMGMCECFTCGIKKHWTELQNGHYEPRSHKNTRFDPRNNHPQCVQCNIFKKGNYPAYAIHLVEKYGQGILKELEQKRLTIKQWHRNDLEELIKKYDQTGNQKLDR